MKIYIKYNSKPPYLPVAVADSPKELARKVGTTASNVSSSISHGRRTYAVVEVEDMNDQ